MIQIEVMTNAIERIATTSDGELLYLWLQRELQRVGMTSDLGALQMLEGRRLLAHDLMNMMATGIDERAQRTGSIQQPPVVFARPGPVAVSRVRGAGRRISDDTTVPGFDTHPDRE